MVVESLLDLMADRLLDLSGIPDATIKKNELEFLLDDEYIVPEGLFLYKEEVTAFQQAQDEVYKMFRDELHKIVKQGDFGFLGFPKEMIDLIIESVEKDQMHLLGRFDFAGGIDGLPIKLLEFNADMPTLLPESILIQEGFNPILNGLPYCDLHQKLAAAFDQISIDTKGSGKKMLGTSFGYQEDVANLNILLKAAGKQGFETYYADLPDVEFSRNEGVFLQTLDQSYVRFDYLIKLIPWEFICFEEPELLADLHNLIMNDLIYVLNPAYTMVFQSKAFLVRLAEKYSSKYLLKATHDPAFFSGKPYVKKAAFGRLGEDITIFNSRGGIIEQTKGDLDLSNCIYQEFALLYKDDYGEYYQPGVYNVNGQSAAVSFRRAERLIVNDDCQFIPHFVKS